MGFYDIFNGDADGICALHQLRLAQPRDAVLVTGVKRDNRLLARLQPRAGDVLTVLDIGLDGNRQDLERALAAGARCQYFDHHHAGAIPQHPGLEAHIDTSAATCTSLIVDRYLGGKHRAWAVVAAYGDNLTEPAVLAGRAMGLDEAALARLQALGECLNYNAYGESIEDLHFHPADLYRSLGGHADPLHYMAESPEFARLAQAYAQDLERARHVPVEAIGERCAAVILPDEKWSRRVNGPFANELALRDPGRANAVLTQREGGFAVSLRAPATAEPGIDTVARRFPGGNGRSRAAGIGFLPQARLQDLYDALRAAYEPPR